MNSSSQPPKELTRNGIRQVCESSNVAADFKDVNMVFQVTSVELFDDSAAKKNIKGRVHLSDGVSKLLVMLSDKAYNALVGTGASLEKYSIWSLPVGKQTI